MVRKPVECMRRPILNNSSPGQAVYEPFVGSGTTLIAAETAVCVGIELNPAYVDVAVECWQRFTGKTAVLEGDGGFFGNLKHCEWAADIPALSVESSVEGGPSQSSKLFQAPGCIVLCFSGRNQSA